MSPSRLPMSDWLAGDLRPMVNDLVLSSDARVLQFLDAAVVGSVMNGTAYTDRNLTYLQYAFLVLELWLREHTDG